MHGLYRDLQPESLYRNFISDLEPVTIIEVQRSKIWSKGNTEG